MTTTNNANQNNANASANVKLNITFGILNEDKVPANAAVLVHEARRRNDEGKYEPVTQFMAVEGVKSTKVTDLIVPLLSVMLADARIRGGFANDFKVVTVGKEKIETKINAKSTFTKWLGGNAIYKSNSEGILNKALVLDDGLHLRNTSLKVTDKQPIYEAKGDLLRVLIFKTAEAISKQACMFTTIHGQAKSIFDAAYAEEKPAKKPAEKPAKKKKAA